MCQKDSRRRLLGADAARQNMHVHASQLQRARVPALEPGFNHGRHWASKTP